MVNSSGTLAWKPNWPQARTNWLRFWQGRGMVIALHPLRQQPIEPRPVPPAPVSMEQRWLDPAYRAARTEYDMATHAFLAEGIPIFDTNIGPGSLGLFLGARAATWTKARSGTTRASMTLTASARSVSSPKAMSGSRATWP